MKTEIETSLSAKLVSLRKQKGLTQMELAEKLNVSWQAISRWEVGTAAPGMDNIKVLCEIYNVSIDSLLSDDKELIGSNADSQIQGNNKTKRKNMWIWILFAVTLLLVVLICCSVLPQKQESGKIKQIEELETIVDDPYPVGVFQFD